MDEDRSESLRDELARDIERALAVEPGPALKAQVHARIDRQRTQVWWSPGRFVIAGAGVLTLGVVWLVIVAAPGPRLAERATERSAERSSGRPQSSNVAAVTPAVPPQLPIVEQARPDPTREVALASRVARRRSFSRPAVAPEAARHEAPPVDIIYLSVAPLEPLREIAIQTIAIQAIAIEPLRRLEPIEGDRQ